MTRGMGGDSPSNVMHHLKGVHFPAKKRDLVSQARGNKAPKAILDTIEQMPDQEYGGPQDVMKAYGQLH